METEEKRCQICGYNKKTLVIIVVLLVIVGGAFYAGAKYEKSKLSKLGLLKDKQNEICQMIATATGEITVKTDNSLTVKTSSGINQEFAISATTKMSKKSTGSIADLAVGQQVTVKGVKNADGSFSAVTITKITQPAAPTTQAN